MKIIAKLAFSKTFRQLKIYLNITNWLREYVFYYVDISKILQIRNMKLLKFSLKTNNVRKTYSSRIKLKNFTFLKKESFHTFQKLLFKSSYLIHHDFKRQMFINLNINKEFDLNVMIYHVKLFVNWNDKSYSSRKSLKSVTIMH